MNVVDATIPWEQESLTPLYDADACAAAQRSSVVPLQSVPVPEPPPALIQLGMLRTAAPAIAGGCHA